MNSALEHMALKDELGQSNLFGEQYGEMLNGSNNSSFCNPLTEDLSALLNKITIKYGSLTAFQKEMLTNVFNAFNNIRISIDPNRLKPFNYSLNGDDELLLHRETSCGLINIIINPEDCIAFSFLPSANGVRNFYFVYPDGDYEKLAYNFFTC